MKKTLLLSLLGLGFLMNAQNVVFYDSFEDYEDFTITNVGAWSMKDKDNSTTYGFSGIPFANSGSKKAFQVFNSTATVPEVTPTDESNWTANTGNKMMVAFASTVPTNDDWLISPNLLLPSDGGSLSFYGKSCDTQYGNEKFTVYVSTSGTDEADFVALQSTQSSPADALWHEYTYDLSSFANKTVYIAIRCTSNDQFGFAIDDFKITSTIAPSVIPTCVTNVAPANAAVDVEVNSRYLSWTAIPYATSYDVYVDKTSSPTTLVGTVVGTAFVPAANWDVSSTYYWRVVAKNSVGDAIGCSISSFTTSSVAPTVGCTTAVNSQWPANILNPTCSAAPNSPVDATTSWASEYSKVNVIAGNTYKFEVLLKTGYFITIATDNNVILASGVGAINYTPSTSETLRFYVHVNPDCSGVANSTTSHTRRVTCLGTLAVSDIAKSNISVYPNPFTDVLKISDVKNVKSIIVSDISGRQVKKVAPASEINLADLKTGLYIVSLVMQDGTVTTTKAIKK